MSNTVVLDSPRQLTDFERNTLQALLSEQFQGSDELRIQANSARVCEEYKGGDPTMIFAVDRQAAPAAAVVSRIPVEAETTDADGMTIHILLHVVEDYLWELEVFREDSAKVMRLPAPAELRTKVF